MTGRREMVGQKLSSKSISLKSSLYGKPWLRFSSQTTKAKYHYHLLRSTMDRDVGTRVR
jgi:hypothetical protein